MKMEDSYDELIDVDSGHDESDEGDVGDVSNGVFIAPQQVFIVKELSKAMAGFRPSVTCEGYLAELSCTSSGYALSPLGHDQQLSFKYEPPSPKFSRKRPSCVSYRLQLLHGSQFLYSLRGLPKTVRCQRASNALEWGPVHVVFLSASDLDTFLGALKYVEVVEQPPAAASLRTSNTTGAITAATSATAATPSSCGGGGGSAGASAEATTAAGVVEEAAAVGGEGRSGFLPSVGGSGGDSMQWAEAAARLLAEVTSAAAPAAAPAAPTEVSRPAGLRHAWPYGTPLLAATAGVALLAALVAAYLFGSRRGRGGADAAAATAVAAAVRRPAGGT